MGHEKLCTSAGQQTWCVTGLQLLARVFGWCVGGPLDWGLLHPASFALGDVTMTFFITRLGEFFFFLLDQDYIMSVTSLAVCPGRRHK
jgi:hypothetical protein